MKTKLLYISLIGLLFSCTKSQKQVTEQTANNDTYQYYPAEIFTAANANIYGNWQLQMITGGLHGSGTALNYATLAISKIGKFSFKNKAGQIESGKIVIEKQTPTELLVSFVAANSVFNPLLSDAQKLIKLSGNDTLHLNSPCCDRYDYLLIRQK